MKLIQAWQKRLQLIELASQARENDLARNAAFAAEQQVFQLLNREIGLLGAWAKVFSGRRFANFMGEGRYEVDVILLTPQQIFLIEVKNWGGALECGADGIWMQRATSGALRQHRDPLQLLANKKQAFLHYLAVQGFSVQENQVQTLLVMARENLRLGTQLLRQANQLIPIGQLTSVLRQNNVFIGKNWLQKMRIRKPQADLGNWEAIQATIRDLPTWDTLVFHGGYEMTGDIIRRSSQLAADVPLTFDAIGPVRIRVPRKLRQLLLRSRAQWRSDGMSHNSPIDPYATITIKPAGAQQALVVRLYELERIEFGDQRPVRSAASMPGMGAGLRPQQKGIV